MTTNDDTSASQPARNLADNIRKLRDERGLTQQQAARLSGVPRATWSNLESGGANPTLSVLTKLADALSVRLEELLGPPKASARLYRASELPLRRRGQVAVRRLLPESMPGLDLERMELAAGARMTGVPHTPGTREYLTCEQGEVVLTAAGERWRLQAGDVVVFRGDQKHGYHNPGKTKAVAYSVIAFAPVGS